MKWRRDDAWRPNTGFDYLVSIPVYKYFTVKSMSPLTFGQKFGHHFPKIAETSTVSKTAFGGILTGGHSTLHR
jgi:hypothetical protein